MFQGNLRGNEGCGRQKRNEPFGGTPRDLGAQTPRDPAAVARARTLRADGPEGPSGASGRRPAARRAQLTKSSARPEAPRAEATPPRRPSRTLSKFRAGRRLAPGPAARPGPGPRSGCGTQVGPIRKAPREASRPLGPRSREGKRRAGGPEPVPASGPCFPGSRQARRADGRTGRRALLPAARSSGRRHRPRPGASLPGGSRLPRPSSRSPPPRS